MALQKAFWLPLAMLAACGPAGLIKGKVTVEGGGSAANIAVFVYGPASNATVTKDDGTFTAASLPDGKYVVRAVVKGAEVEDVSVPASIKDGKAEGDVTLAFRFPAGKVTGKVVFADASLAENLTVTLQGTVSRATRTGGGGAFTFEAVPAGAYLVAVEAQDTREGRVGVGVAMQGSAVDVGELRLSPVGHVAGTVTGNSMPIAGATVLVAGTSLSVTTDALGKFALEGVPTGDQTFIARTASPPQVANQTVMVTRGANADLALALMAETRRGTVTGTVTFVGQQSPKSITVSVPGTSATATPAGNGAYTLQVPEGDWDVVATAPSYPKKVIARANVLQGQTTILPGEVLSWFEPIWDNTQVITGFAITAISNAPNNWYGVRITDTGNRTLLVNRTTKEVRLLAAANVVVTFSANAKYLWFAISGQLFTYELATADLKAWGIGTDPSLLYAVFSSDESTLFVSRATATGTPGSFLERIALSTGTITRFPATGVLNVAPQYQTADRHFVTLATNAVTMVTPTGEVPNVFTQVSRLYTASTDATPLAMALTGCTTVAPVVCTLRILPATSTATQAVINAGTFGAAIPGYGGTTEWPWVLNAAGIFSIVRASDATCYPLLAGSNAPVYNQTGTRFAYLTTVTTTTALREDVFPPSPNPSPLVQATAPTAFSAMLYITPTRLIASDLTPASAQRRIYDIKSGVLTTEADVPNTGPTAATWMVGGSMVAWPAATKWKVIIADKPTLTIDIPATTTPFTPSSLRARQWTAGMPGPDVGAISFDGATAYTIDAAQQVKRSFAGHAGAGLGAERIGSTEVWFATRGFGLAIVPFANDQYIDLQDPAVTPVVTQGNAVERTWFGLSGNRLVMGWLR